MRDRGPRLEPDVIARPPVELGARHLVADAEPGVVVVAERRHVQVQGALLRAEGVQGDHGQDGVAGGGIDLGVGEDLVVVDVVEVQGPQLLERGVLAPDPVERAQPGRQRLSGGLGGREVAGPQFVLLRVEVFLAALGDRLPLVEFVARVHAPGGREGRGEGGADREHRRAAALERLVQDVRGVGEHVGPRLVDVGQQLLAELDQIGLAGLPREVRVGLREPPLGEPEQPGRSGERLGEEQHVGLGALDLADEPVPEVGGLGVRVVHTEDPHAQ